MNTTITRIILTRKSARLTFLVFLPQRDFKPPPVPASREPCSRSTASGRLPKATATRRLYRMSVRCKCRGWSTRPHRLLTRTPPMVSGRPRFGCIARSNSRIGCRRWRCFALARRFYGFKVWVNGQFLADNARGQVPIQFDIRKALRPGTNEICIGLRTMASVQPQSGKMASGSGF